MLVGERPIVSRAEGERVRSVVPFKTVDMQDQEQLGIDCRQSPCTERDAWFAENIDKVYPSEYDTDLLVSRPALMPDGTPRECAIAMCGRSSDGDFVESRTCLIKGLGCVYHRCCLDAQVRMISRRTRILVSGGGVSRGNPRTRDGGGTAALFRGCMPGRDAARFTLTLGLITREGSQSPLSAWIGARGLPYVSFLRRP